MAEAKKTAPAGKPVILFHGDKGGWARAPLAASFSTGR